jgi:hypothetical protein
LWLDHSGDVRRVALLGSTGRAGRDAAIVKRLQSAWLGEPPPTGLPQPATLIVLPRATGLPPYCGPGELAGATP